jgi:phosphatidate phosphatase PAH1
MAGAIDIMVVQQPDGSLKCSPFYGRMLLLQEQLLCLLLSLAVLQQQQQQHQ